MDAAFFNKKSEALRRWVLNPWVWPFVLSKKLPMGAFAGLRVQKMDTESCTIILPFSRRTKNPFGSTYALAQGMAAEVSSGVPAFVLIAGAPVSVSMPITNISGSFPKKAVDEIQFTFSDVFGMKKAVQKAAMGNEAVSFVARSVGCTADGTVVSIWDTTWSFKRRSKKAAA